MSMTRKHFVRIAATLKAQRTNDKTYEETLWLDQVCQDFADMLAGENPNFDRERFLDACWYE